MSADLQIIVEIVAGHMEQIQSLFKPDAKITVLVRAPEHPERDFVLTDDDLNEVIAAVHRRVAQ